MSRNPASTSMEEAVRQAKYSIEVITGPWDHTLEFGVERVGPAFPPPTVLLDATGHGLQLRCLFITSRTPATWEFATKELVRVGWQVRYFASAQTANFILIDNKIAFVRAADRNPNEYHRVDDREQVATFIHYFNNVWTFAIEHTQNEVLYDDIVAPTYPSVITTFAQTVHVVSSSLLQYFAQHPERLREMPPRRFEELVAELLTRDGYDVQLTPQSKDGGRDILAIRNDDLVPQLLLVECKRYAADNPVGVHLVRALYGVVQHERATAGLLASTSSFTKGAVAFQRSFPYQLTLKDYESIVKWLRRVSPRIAS